MTSRVPMSICFSQGIWQYHCVKSTIPRRCTTDDDNVIADGGHGDRIIHKRRRHLQKHHVVYLFLRYNELCTEIGDDNVRVDYSYYRRCLLCGPPTIGVQTTFAFVFHNCCYLYSTIVPHSLRIWLQNPPATATIYFTNAGLDMIDRLHW
jgi:hypothetical protein